MLYQDAYKELENEYQPKFINTETTFHREFNHLWGSSTHRDIDLIRMGLDELLKLYAKSEAKNEKGSWLRRIARVFISLFGKEDGLPLKNRNFKL